MIKLSEDQFNTIASAQETAFYLGKEITRFKCKRPFTRERIVFNYLDQITSLHDRWRV